MKRPRLFEVVLAALLLSLVTLIVSHQAKSGIEAPLIDNAEIRFEFVDVWVDSATQKLAAYQFELALENGTAEIVGLEGGGHRAFAEPPYYDPAALHGKRIIVAAFNTGVDLPKGKTRVARLHMQITGIDKPHYVVKLMESCGPSGEKIPATAGVN